MPGCFPVDISQPNRKSLIGRGKQGLKLPMRSIFTLHVAGLDQNKIRTVKLQLNPWFRVCAARCFLMKVLPPFYSIHPLVESYTSHNPKDRTLGIGQGKRI